MIRVNLLGLPKQKKRRAPVVTLQGWQKLVLLLAILVLVGVVQYMRLGRLQENDQRVTKLIKDKTAEKARLEGIRGDFEKFSTQKALLQKRIGIIEGLKAKQSGPTRLLDMLASTVTHTDTLWVTNFEQAGQKVTIDGIALSAKAVADFLTQLRATKAFTEIDLKETFQDPAVQEVKKFQFTVNGELVGAAPTS